jgi:hypothetical protein
MITRRRWIWGGLLASAAWLAVFGDKTPPSEAAMPTPRAVPRAFASPRPAPAASAVRLEPLIARDLLVPERAPLPAARNPFYAAVVPPPPAASAASAPPAPAPPPPTAPPLPYTVVGKKLEGGAWEVYLSRGDQVLVATAGTMLEGQYKVERIQPPTMNLIYLPLGRAQSLSIGDAQ